MVKILIVSSEADIRLVSRLVLEKAYPDYLVYTAEDGEDAMATAEKTMPDLVFILGCNSIGKIDGLTLCKLLRESPRTQKTKIAVASASGTRMMVPALISGASSFIVMPFDPRELAKTTKELLEEA